MKVILLQDVKKLGKKGDVIEASDGYARNYLFPKKLATEATANELHVLNAKKENERKKKLAELEEAQKLAAELKGKEVTIEAKAGDGGRLFGSITSKDIAEQLKKQHSIEVDKRKVMLDEPIRVLGSRFVEIKIHQKVTTKIRVDVREKQ